MRGAPPSDQPLPDHRHLSRWIVLAAAGVGLAATMAAVYLSLLTGVLVLAGGTVGVVLAVARLAPSGAPADRSAQLAALEAAWSKEVPASREAMLRAYLDDPAAAVRSLTAGHAGLDAGVAHEFLAGRVTDR